MPGMTTSQNSLNVCMAERVWTKNVLQRELFGFFLLRFLGTIYSLPRILPDEDRGEKNVMAQKWLYSTSLQSDSPVSEVSSQSTIFPFCIHSSPLKVDSEIQRDLTGLSALMLAISKTSHSHHWMTFSYPNVPPIAGSQGCTCREWPGSKRAMEKPNSITDSKKSPWNSKPKNSSVILV